KGMGGVGGRSFVVLVGTVGRMGVGGEGVGFIGGVDCMMDMGRRVVKLSGNGVGGVVMCKWEGEYEAEKGQGVMSGEDVGEVREA
ncbi:cation:dicarboxylate symporter family transporter, partial [Bacillus altitudinis]|uniref:cation:dicarboxylate symporter family transporter n=1 Tax=Bacillus altitudinis TaxID=293387 RepID=UPI001C92F6DB